MKFLIFLTVFVICVTYVKAADILCPPKYPTEMSSNEYDSFEDGSEAFNVSAQSDCFHYCTVFHGNVRLNECPVGLQYDLDSNECVADINCPDSRCPLIDDPNNLVYLRAPSCNQFYECSNRKAVLFTCPAGLNWSLEGKICDWPPTDCIDLPVPE